MTPRQAPETRATRPETRLAFHVEAEATAHVMRSFAETPAAFPGDAREEMRRFGDGLSSLAAQKDGAPERGAPARRDAKVRIRRL